MRKSNTFFAAALFLCSLKSFGSPLSLNGKLELAKSRCSQKPKEEKHFFMDDFKSQMTFEEMQESYDLTYNRPERLFNRAVYVKSSAQFISSNGKISVNLPQDFIKTVILHIENALRMKYVDYIFFPDMGHSHFLIPPDFFKREIVEKKHGPMPDALNTALRAPELKSLYHTAERLNVNTGRQIPNDSYIRWRFYTRNPVMDDQGNIELFTNLESQSNTVSSVPGYEWFAGIAISANKSGCFPFETASGEIEYFDISAWDPPYDCVNNFCG